MQDHTGVYPVQAWVSSRRKMNLGSLMRCDPSALLLVTLAMCRHADSFQVLLPWGTNQSVMYFANSAQSCVFYGIIRQEGINPLLFGL